MKQLVLAAFVALAASPAAAQIEPPTLGLPIACALGEDCVIQQYVDTDPGPGAKDHTCGDMTYDGHKGTDFRIADLDMMAQGVTVMAASDGEVKAVRDGMDDFQYKRGEDDIPADRACGNGLLIDHGNGWTTQYCHLKKGSVSVEKGDMVQRGSIIGQVGQSGWTEFPHVHLQVMYEGKVVDPFASAETGMSGETSCGESHGGMWEEAAAEQLEYRYPAILNTGFTDGGVEMKDVDSREKNLLRLDASTPALVFFGRAVGLKPGDTQRITITSPDGSTLVTNSTDPEQTNRAQAMAFVGKKRPASGWQPGVYAASYEVIREGETIAEETGSIALAQ
ncbi:M23 family metallopeptidase [Tepidamorphus sp. 3E244]|uniref:M23 family metallopeptidase n=1 Tax=Tepidamorphus sp. 3E244 TaxID=3385498 RepID=UPI0038FD182E